MADAYRGALGAVPYAFRRSDSWLFKLYAVLGTLATLLISLFILLSLVVLMGQTAAFEGGSLTLSRAFYILVGLFLVAPLLAPILLVARRHRRSENLPADASRYDRALAAAGLLFLATIYLALVISAPDATEPSGGAVITALNGLPDVIALGPLLASALLIVLVHRISR